MLLFAVVTLATPLTTSVGPLIAVRWVTGLGLGGAVPGAPGGGPAAAGDEAFLKPAADLLPDKLDPDQRPPVRHRHVERGAGGGGGQPRGNCRLPGDRPPDRPPRRPDSLHQL